LEFFEKNFNIVESYTRGSFSMLMISALHENLMGFGRRLINLMKLTEKLFPKFFHNAYRKNNLFRINATFIFEPKK
jgi:hypothetical protein